MKHQYEIEKMNMDEAFDPFLESLHAFTTKTTKMRKNIFGSMIVPRFTDVRILKDKKDSSS